MATGACITADSAVTQWYDLAHAFRRVDHATALPIRAVCKTLLKMGNILVSVDLGIAALSEQNMVDIFGYPPSCSRWAKQSRSGRCGVCGRAGVVLSVPFCI